MKKRILCIILAMLMLIATLPLSVLASDIAEATTGDNDPPVVSVSSKEDIANSFGALPDNDGVFYLDISLDKAPKNKGEVIVYYRTVDDSAVAEWGDYESVGIDASVTLNQANKYTARVVIKSKILDNGFYTDDENGEPNKDRIISRRFLFELTSVEGDAELSEDKSELYCYLRASNYLYQDQNAQTDSDKWKAESAVSYWEFVDALFAQADYRPEDPEWVEEYEFYQQAFAETWKKLSKNKPSNYYYTLDGASALSTPPLQYGKQTSHSDNINLSFDEEWQSYVQSGWCDLGISINGTVTRDYWDSDGEATFNLYYYHGGEKKLALTLYLEGEFDDSTHFGWEHAFKYAIDGSESSNKKDHMSDNFIGFTVYDNNGKEAYKVKKDGSVIDVCGQLNKTLIDGNAVEMLSGFQLDDNVLLWALMDAARVDITSYYLRLPSNFALADSYSYDFTSYSTDSDEIRWLEDVKIVFTLISNKQPSIAKDEKGNQMVTTNLETMKEDDPIRMSVRFDRPVHIADPNGNCYITTDIYNDKGALVAKGVKLTLKQLADSNSHYAWDTLVFEGDLPDTLDGIKIASLRNIKIVDGSEDKNNPTTDGIKSFFTELKILSKSINNIYIDRDFRTPVATIGSKVSELWTKSKSIDIYVNVKENSSARFNDYVTVYYEWNNDPKNPPQTYSSKVIFHTGKDGDILKTIIGTGNGEMYLHMKAVSAYGKSSISDAVTTVYDPTAENAKYTPFGPFKFDNIVPELVITEDNITGTMTDKVITFDLPEDSSGLQSIELYSVIENAGTGEKTKKLLDTLSYNQGFTNDTKEVSFNISHTDVGIGLDNKPESKKIEFYFVLTDRVGNVSNPTGKFSLVFDTNDYISEDVMKKIGPLYFKGYDDFIEHPTTIYDRTYLYNYKDNNGNTIVKSSESKPIYYSFGFEINGKKLIDDKKEYYSILISYNGVPLASDEYSVLYDTEVETFVDGVISWRVKVHLHKEIASGRYDIRLVRSPSDDPESKQVSQVYTVYATANENDNTAIKNKVEFGTLLSNTVYQLSTDYPHFYYKDKDGVIQKEYYNGTKQPASFSNFEKAKEYVYYKELSDIYLVQLSAATATALSNSNGGYLRADGETMVPQEGQFWIRYKRETWEPTSGDSAWVYYYYGESDVLSEGALSANLLKAINTVATRITGYGKSVILTDSSLFLGSTTGDKMLDEYGMPYLLPGQLHVTDELSKKTMCENTWSNEVGFAADKNIYKSTVSVGVEGTADYKEYPIVGNFALPEDSILQYMTYEQYNGDTPTWKVLNTENGKSFINLFGASGIYYIREFSTEGVSIYAIYIDKEAPDVTFSQTDDNGNFKEIPVDGKEILDIRTKDMYIGSIAPSEYDRLSYVAVYKASNLSLVGIYTAGDLASAPIKLEDGNYYIVVSDRSGNHYTVTAKVSSTLLECNITESTDKHIKVTCNRRSDQILRYEVYLNGELVTSTYAEEQTFTKAGLYTIYIQDIYGNDYTYINKNGEEGYLFVRNYPEVTWKYRGADGKYHTASVNDTNANGFILTWVSDNQYKISTAVQTRFAFSGDYAYEFIGLAPKYNETLGAETSVTIEAGQSFTLKVYYKNHKDCYVIYTGTVDVTPPSVNVSAEIDILRNGEYSLFEDWAQKGNVGDIIAMKDLYYVLSEIKNRTVSSGGVVSSDNIKINASDASDLSLIEVYLDGELITKQDTNFSQITVDKWGKYRVVAKDKLGNVAEFTFTNGAPNYFDYFVDGEKKETELHGYLNFETVGGKQVYTKIDFGNKNFKLDLKQDVDVFMSVGESASATEICGFRISDGQIYPLTYNVILDKNGNKTIDLVAGEAILGISVKDFKIGQEYLISKAGAPKIYASVGSDKTVSIKVYAPEDPSKIISVSARIEDLSASKTSFISAELSKKSSNVSFKDVGVQTNSDIRINSDFIIDESTFESERIASISLYYSKLNNLDVNNLIGKTNIYTTDREYDSEGFYLLIIRNLYGNESIYKISISRSFGITSSVTFGDGHKIFYSKDYNEKLYSNGVITLDILEEDVTVTVTLNGSAYTDFEQKKDGSITYLVFSKEGTYEVKMTDAYGNQITRQFEINKSTYSASYDLFTGYNDKALKRDMGYTNQKLSVNKSVYDSSGIYYLAIQYGESLNVIVDAFAESPISNEEEDLINVIGSDGDGIYKVICRNRYGAVVTMDIHYRGTPTLKLERTTRANLTSEIYDLDYATSLGFWSNNTLSFSTDAKTYVFTINGSVTECPKTIIFDSMGDYGSFEYIITYIDEYGFEYNFNAYLVRKNVAVEIPSSVAGTEIDGVINTKNDILLTFGDNIYATYTRNNGDEVIYRSGDVLKKDGTYRFTVIDYAGNATLLTIKKDTAVEFSFVDSISGNVIQNGSVVNSSKIGFNDLNNDSSYIEKVIHNGVVKTDFTGSKFTEDGKWELIICDKLGNRSYFSFYIVTHAQNGFSYTTPYEYRITELWYDSGDGVKVTYMTFVNHTDYNSSFSFDKNGKYYAVMTSNVTGTTSSFEFTVNTTAPAVSLMGCSNGETTINDVTLTGYKVGDHIKIYRSTETGEELVHEVEITSLATQVPTISEGGKYRIVVESEAGVQTELSLVRKHVMNTAGSVFIMVVISLSVIGLFTGLVYRNKSKTDD